MELNELEINMLKALARWSLTGEKLTNVLRARHVTIPDAEYLMLLMTKGLIELTTGYSLTDKGKEGLVRWALARGKRTARGVAAITGLPLTEVSPILASLQH